MGIKWQHVRVIQQLKFGIFRRKNVFIHLQIIFYLVQEFLQKKGIIFFSFLVWSVNFHSCGDFITSASQDKTVRLWDLNRLDKINKSIKK